MVSKRGLRRPLWYLTFVLGIVAASVVATVASARGNAPARAGASIKVCVLLPDTTTSTRYTLFDAPLLTKAFKKAKVAALVLNAHGDPQKQRSQAEQCLSQGAKVFLFDQLDPASGVGITNLVIGRGGKVIDYDRLVVGSKAALYVSFDNVRVGRLMGTNLVAALKKNKKYRRHPVIAELNGDIKDNNAKLFKQGYDSVLTPLYNRGVFKRATAGDQYTEWSSTKARGIFDQILARNNNKVDAAIAANDNLAGAVIASLKAHGLKPIPLTGQDATPTGIQFVLAGWQSGSVYKSEIKETSTAAKAAIALLHGKKVKTNAVVSGTKSILLKPQWITKKNYKILFRDKFLKRNQVCNGQYKKLCK